jgi:hypothetical protein
MTKPLDETTTRKARFDQALKCIEAYVRALDHVEPNKETIFALKAIVSYLRKLDEGTINLLITTNRSIAKSVGTPTRHPGPENSVIANMSLRDVETVINSQDSSLSYLKRIAALRFAFAPGALSRLSRENLIQKLRDTIENEKTHETIGRLAGYPPARSGDK